MVWKWWPDDVLLRLQSISTATLLPYTHTHIVRCYILCLCAFIAWCAIVSECQSASPCSRHMRVLCRFDIGWQVLNRDVEWAAANFNSKRETGAVGAGMRWAEPLHHLGLGYEWISSGTLAWLYFSKSELHKAQNRWRNVKNIMYQIYRWRFLFHLDFVLWINLSGWRVFCISVISSGTRWM